MTDRAEVTWGVSIWNLKRRVVINYWYVSAYHATVWGAGGAWHPALDELGAAGMARAPLRPRVVVGTNTSTSGGGGGEGEVRGQSVVFTRYRGGHLEAPEGASNSERPCPSPRGNRLKRKHRREHGHVSAIPFATARPSWAVQRGIDNWLSEGRGPNGILAIRWPFSPLSRWRLSKGTGRPIAVHFKPLPRLYQGMASVNSVELRLVVSQMWIDLAHPSGGCMWHWSKSWVDGTIQRSRPLLQASP